MKKRLLSLLMAMVLCVSGTVVTQGTVVEAAMVDEAENYELGTEYNGYVEDEWGHNGSREWRYFKFAITEKSYVTLKVGAYTTNICCNIYDSNGEIVLKENDIILKTNDVTDETTGSQSRILEAGTYYLLFEGRNTEFNFTIQAEPQIKLPKGVISSLKTSKAGQITVKCEDSEDAIGYRIMYSTDYKFKKDVKTVMSDEPTKTISGLKKGAKYYVKVCPYTVYDDGTEVFGQNSKVKSIRVKK